MFKIDQGSSQDARPRTGNRDGLTMKQVRMSCLESKTFWRFFYPIVTGAGAFAVGGVGPGLFTFVVVGIFAALTARIDQR